MPPVHPATLLKPLLFKRRATRGVFVYHIRGAPMLMHSVPKSRVRSKSAWQVAPDDVIAARFMDWYTSCTSCRCFNQKPINDSMSVYQEHTDCVYIEVDQSKQSVIQDVNVLMFKFVQDRSQENYPWTWTLPSSAICVNLSMYPTLSYTKDIHTSGCWFNLMFLL